MINLSYADYERSVPRGYAKAVCDLFANLGVRGVSVFFASGDFGVGGGSCKTNGNIRFMPTFPAGYKCDVVFSAASGTQVQVQIAYMLPRFCRTLCHKCRRNDRRNDGVKSGGRIGSI